MERTIAVFARWPEPGRVKTRLSPALPANLACDLHRAMLADTLSAVRSADAEQRILLWGDAPAAASHDGWPETEGVAWGTQRGAGLGERLEAAFDDRRAARGAMVIVGSDAPELAEPTLRAAFHALQSTDLVLGPTPDGGYYLVGLARPPAGLFRDVRWGSERALHDTRERAAALGMSCRMLEPLADVDTGADLASLIARLLERPGRAPATAAALARLGLVREAEPSG
jgi:rSAM/selenodomain-associated transferase 1